MHQRADDSEDSPHATTKVSPWLAYAPTGEHFVGVLDESQASRRSHVGIGQPAGS